MPSLRLRGLTLRNLTAVLPRPSVTAFNLHQRTTIRTIGMMGMGTGGYPSSPPITFTHLSNDMEESTKTLWRNHSEAVLAATKAIERRVKIAREKEALLAGYPANKLRNTKEVETNEIPFAEMRDRLRQIPATGGMSQWDLLTGRVDASEVKDSSADEQEGTEVVRSVAIVWLAIFAWFAGVYWTVQKINRAHDEGMEKIRARGAKVHDEAMKIGAEAAKIHADTMARILTDRGRAGAETICPVHATPGCPVCTSIGCVP